MAHEIEKVVLAREAAWHRLGTVLPGDIPFDDAQELAGLGFTVRLDELWTAAGVKVDSRAVVRTDTGAALGVVGPRYTPLQNTNALEFFRPFVESGLVGLESAGSLSGGSKVWVMAKIKKDNSVIVKNDEIAKYVLVSNSHDGKTAVRVGFTPIRVVCSNTQAQAHNSKASKLIRICHGKNVAVNLEKMQDIINIADEEFEATAEQYRFLASKQFNQKDIRKFVKTVLDIKVDDADIKTRAENRIKDIVERCVNGIEQDNPAVRGTWYAAYNGVSEYLSYANGRNENNRYSALWFGTAATMNANALKIATQMAV